MNQIQKIYVLIHKFKTKKHYLYKDVTDAEGETKNILRLSLLMHNLILSANPHLTFDLLLPR
jgi:hypothetical protein